MVQENLSRKVEKEWRKLYREYQLKLEGFSSGGGNPDLKSQMMKRNSDFRLQDGKIIFS